jgi:hypothetical protein
VLKVIRVSLEWNLEKGSLEAPFKA